MCGLHHLLLATLDSSLLGNGHLWVCWHCQDMGITNSWGFHCKGRTPASWVLRCQIIIGPRVFLGELRPWCFVAAVLGGSTLGDEECFCENSLKVSPVSVIYGGFFFFFWKPDLLGCSMCAPRNNNHIFRASVWRISGAVVGLIAVSLCEGQSK